MTWYTFFKSLHVVAAVIWVGGAVMIQAYAVRILRTKDARRMAEFAKDTEIVSMRVFIPATWVLLLAAIGMMINLDLSWGQNWVVLGLIAWTLSFIVGAGYLGPEGGRIAKIIENEGPESPAAQFRIARVLLVSRLDLVILLTVVVNMVVKPVGNAGWFWGLLAAMVLGLVAVLGAAYSSSSMRSAPPATRSPSAT
jgi:uncharacterized membrane protein